MGLLVALLSLVSLFARCHERPRPKLATARATRAYGRIPPECAGAQPHALDEIGLVQPRVKTTGKFGIPARNGVNAPFLILEVMIRKDGRVCAAAIFRGGENAIEHLQDVKTWTFEPARVKGVPVDVHGFVSMSARPVSRLGG